jgi:cytochrome b involved in lipid metabolism
MLLGASLLIAVLVIFVSTKWSMFSYFFSKKEQPPTVKAGRDGGDPGRIDDDGSANESIQEEPTHTTAQAQTQANGSLTAQVPILNLEPPPDSDDEDDLKHLPPPPFPAVDSAQRANGPSSTRGPPKLKPLLHGTPLTDAQLMPPPPRPGALRPPPNSTAALRVPAGPLPNRSPPTNNTLAVPSYRLTNPARQKVILEPGYSPLNWATLQRSARNLSGVDRLLRVTPSMLGQMNGRKGRPAWSSYQGKVYNITPYLPFHPGGEGQLRRAAGRDGEQLFTEVHPWVNWENMLGVCVVGILVPEGAGDGTAKNQLENLD